MATEEYVKSLLAEIEKRRSRKVFDLRDILFDQQLTFVNDPAPFKTAVCTRRSGKTVACAADLVYTAYSNPGVTCLYITLSRNNAKKIIWPELKKINREFNLGGIINESDLSIKFIFNSIESTIYCSGASDKTEIEKFRGLAFKKVYLDESQSFPQYIKDLVDDVISPALMDYAGSLCLIGTPGPIPAGYFYECSNHPDWSHHSWTFWDNPHIAIKSNSTHKEILERELRRRGVTVEDPSIRREWYGEWILDSESLVFRYDKIRNDYKELPPANYVYIMGLDFGFNDADAIAILAWSENSPITYLVEEVITEKQGLSPLVEQVEALRKKYNISKIVADFGGLGKKLGEEMIRRFQIPVVAAEKSRKVEAIELLNDAMRRSHFMASKSSRFASDSIMVEWDLDKSTPEKKVVSDRFHSDILDAALYAFRESPSYAWSPEIPKPKYQTPEWYKQEVTDMEQAAEDYFKLQEDPSSF